MWNMSNALTISALIAQLQAVQNEYGDVGVIVDGGDYPEACTEVVYNASNRPHYPARMVIIR